VSLRYSIIASAFAMILGILCGIGIGSEHFQTINNLKGNDHGQICP
jgi:hypothetical protein